MRGSALLFALVLGACAVPPPADAVRPARPISPPSAPVVAATAVAVAEPVPSAAASEPPPPDPPAELETPKSTGPLRTPPIGTVVRKRIVVDHVYVAKSEADSRYAPELRRKHTWERTVPMPRDQEAEIAILAAHDDVIDRASVHYPHADWAGRPMDIDGKTFLVEATKDGPRITPSPHEKPWVGSNIYDEHPEVGGADPVMAALRGRLIGTGAEVPALVPIVLHWMWSFGSLGHGGQRDLLAVSVRLAAVRAGPGGKESVFAVSVRDAKPARVWSDPKRSMRGTFVARKLEGWPVSFEMGGTYVRAGQTMFGRLTHTGKVKLSMSWSYETPAAP